MRTSLEEPDPGVTQVIIRQDTAPSGPCQPKARRYPLPDHLSLFQDHIMVGEARQRRDVLVDDEDRLAG